MNLLLIWYLLPGRGRSALEGDGVVVVMVEDRGGKYRHLKMSPQNQTR